METDTQLLRRFAEHQDDNAFAELVRRRLPLVYAVAWRRTRDRAAAEDAALRVFCALAQKAGSLSGHPTVLGWLYRAAHGAAIDLVRSETRRKRRERTAHTMNEILSGEHSGAASPSIAWTEARWLLDAAMADLSDSERDAVLLRCIDQRGYGEIGTLLGVSDNTARMKVNRALGKLQRKLARLGITSSLAAVEAAIAETAPAPPTPVLAAQIARTATSTAMKAGTTSLAAAWFAAVTLAAGFGVSVYLWIAANHMEAQLAAPGRAEPHLSVLRGCPPGSAIARPGRTAASTSGPTTADAAKIPTWNAKAEGDKFMAKHPEVKAALRAFRLAQVHSRFEGLHRSRIWRAARRPSAAAFGQCWFPLSSE